MIQFHLNLRTPIAAYADKAHLNALAAAAKSLMNQSYVDRDIADRMAKTDPARAERERLADEGVAMALRVHNVHNSLEALLPSNARED